MIRRFLSLVTLLLMLTGGALGNGVIPNFRETAADTSQNTPFSFRGGVKWNMSREQVRATDSVPMIEKSQDSWSILLPLEPVEVSRLTAELVYMFYNDQLKMISYDFRMTGTSADYAYLTGALDSVYGEHTVPEAYEVIGIMDQIYPGNYKEDQLTHLLCWTSGDDTRIFQYFYGENAYAILYVCMTAGGPGQNGYVTTGL